MNNNFVPTLQAVRFNPNELLNLIRHFFSPHPTRLIYERGSLSLPSLILIMLGQLIFNSLAWMFTFKKFFINSVTIKIIADAYPSGKTFLIMLLVNFILLALLAALWHVISILLRGTSNFLDILFMLGATQTPTVIFSIISCILAFISPSISSVVLLASACTTIQFIHTSFEMDEFKYRIDKYWIFVVLDIILIFALFLLIRSCIIPALLS